MIAVVSPAKKLDFSDINHNLAESMVRSLPESVPELWGEGRKILALAKKLSRSDLKRLMKISDKLADLNYLRYQDFDAKNEVGALKQAALVFAGDTYVGLDAASLSEEDLVYGQGCLRILSGLYGLLRPLDMMQAYRLEMGVKLANDAGEDLYDFWLPHIAKALDMALKGHEEQVVVNLASNEYIKSVDRKQLNARIVDCVFKDEKDGKARVLGVFAKRARGMMARFIILNRVETVEGLKGFDGGGYRFVEGESDLDRLVFVRPQPPKKT